MDPIVEQIKQMLQAGGLSLEQANIGIVQLSDTRLMTVQLTKVCEYEQLPDSSVRGPIATHDKPFGKPTNCPGGQLDPSEACDFIDQCEADEQDQGSLDANDYNNLGCAYLWCDENNPDYKKAEEAFRKAKDKARTRGENDIIERNLDRLPKIYPLLPWELHRWDIAALFTAIDNGEAPEFRILRPDEIRGIPPSV